MRTNKQKLRLACDKIWQDIIKSRGACEICGATQNLVGHHIITKHESSYLRYSIKNGICLCQHKCHFGYHIKQSIIISKGIIERVGEETYKWLKDVYKTPVKLNVLYYEDRLEELNKIKEALGGFKN